MGNSQVRGGSTHSMFSRLIEKGPTHKCSISGQYFQQSEMNPDGRGGWVAKKFDMYIDRHGTHKKSKYKSGLDWRRATV